MRSEIIYVECKVSGVARAEEGQWGAQFFQTNLIFDIDGKLQIK